NGLRIDHPDGLYDPKQYLQRLQQHYVLARVRYLFETQPATGGPEWKQLQGPLLEEIANRMHEAKAAPCARPLSLVVAKMLGLSESLPEDWPVYGTSGYDFLNLLTGLFVGSANVQAFTQLYNDWIQDAPRFAEVVYEKKFLILQIAMSGELQMLAHQ